MWFLTRPRTIGAMLLTLAIIAVAGNLVLIFYLHLYYPTAYQAGGLLGGAGMWMAASGHPRATTDGRSTPVWAWIGFGVFVLLGAAFGVALTFFNWEATLAGV
jgi:hypothetical protein